MAVAAGEPSLAPSIKAAAGLSRLKSRGDGQANGSGLTVS